MKRERNMSLSQLSAEELQRQLFQLLNTDGASLPPLQRAVRAVRIVDIGAELRHRGVILRDSRGEALN